MPSVQVDIRNHEFDCPFPAFPISTVVLKDACKVSLTELLLAIIGAIASAWVLALKSWRKYFDKKLIGTRFDMMRPYITEAVMILFWVFGIISLVTEIGAWSEIYGTITAENPMCKSVNSKANFAFILPVSQQQECQKAYAGNDNSCPLALNSVCDADPKLQFTECQKGTDCRDCDNCPGDVFADYCLKFEKEFIQIERDFASYCGSFDNCRYNKEEYICEIEGDPAERHGWFFIFMISYWIVAITRELSVWVLVVYTIVTKYAEDTAIGLVRNSSLLFLFFLSPREFYTEIFEKKSKDTLAAKFLGYTVLQTLPFMFLSIYYALSVEKSGMGAALIITIAFGSAKLVTVGLKYRKYAKEDQELNKADTVAFESEFESEHPNNSAAEAIPGYEDIAEEAERAVIDGGDCDPQVKAEAGTTQVLPDAESGHLLATDVVSSDSGTSSETPETAAPTAVAEGEQVEE